MGELSCMRERGEAEKQQQRESGRAQVYGKQGNHNNTRPNHFCCPALSLVRTFVLLLETARDCTTTHFCHTPYTALKKALLHTEHTLYNQILYGTSVEYGSISYSDRITQAALRMDITECEYMSTPYTVIQYRSPAWNSAQNLPRTTAISPIEYTRTIYKTLQSTSAKLNSAADKRPFFFLFPVLVRSTECCRCSWIRPLSIPYS